MTKVDRARNATLRSILILTRELGPHFVPAEDESVDASIDFTLLPNTHIQVGYDYLAVSEETPDETFLMHPSIDVLERNAGRKIARTVHLALQHARDAA